MDQRVRSGGVRRQEPLFNAPGCIVLSLAVLLAIHFAYWALGEAFDDQVLVQAAFLPARLTVFFSPHRLDLLAQQAANDPVALERLRALQPFQIGADLKPWTLLTYALVHGSWTHVGLNAIWLLAFGTPVARRLGALPYFGLCAGGAVAAALAHWALDPMGAAPLIGASGSVSALMGACARFMFSPGGVQRGMLGEGPPPPLPPLAALLRDRPALLFVGSWAVLNFIFGAGAVEMGLSEAPVAWVAHVGGFAFGLLTLGLFERPRGVVALAREDREER